MPQAITYKHSGVNIDVANRTKRALKGVIKSKEPRLLNSLGAFASLYDVRFPEYKRPLLVMKTEEPGSKQILAFKYNKFESICFDMINHLINDCIVMGAKPLSVQDAIICGKLEKDKVLRMVGALHRACEAQGCVLSGGEISEQPAVIPAGTYILTSSVVGIVDRKAVIDGSAIRVGDTVVALASSGPHTNGYSLIRKILKVKPALAKHKVGGVPWIELLLKPHHCYYPALKGLFPTGLLKGMAHITGGGIRENLDRILPAKVDALIDLSSYRIPPVFGVIKQYGNVPDAEMLRTFNLGVGLAVVCRSKDAARVIRHSMKHGVDAYPIGTIVKGTGKVSVVNSLRWK